MAKNTNHYRLYNKDTQTWHEVSEEQYRAVYRWRTALRRRMQYHHLCNCPRHKFWLCSGVCVDCEFNTAAVISIDAPVPDGDGTFAELMPDNRPTPDEVAADRDLLERLISRLHEIEPEADRIIEIWLDHPEGISDRKVAEMLGRPASTFRDEMRKFRAEARKIRGDED